MGRKIMALVILFTSMVLFSGVNPASVIGPAADMAIVPAAEPVTVPSIESAPAPTAEPMAIPTVSPADAAAALAIPIVYYHSVKTVPKNQLCMPPEQLEEQMKYLYDHHFESISLRELYDFLYENGTLPPKPIVITFDDGYKDNYTNALPILRKYGFTAAVFVTAGQNGPDFLTRDEMRELLEAGWEIESHTMTHPDLSKLNPSKLQWELQHSKKLLEQDLGREVKFLAYPYGKFNEAVVKEVKEAGYLMAFTTKAGWATKKHNPWLVNRVYLYANMGIEEFARRVEDPVYEKQKVTHKQG